MLRSNKLIIHPRKRKGDRQIILLNIKSVPAITTVKMATEFRNFADSGYSPFLRWVIIVFDDFLPLKEKPVATAV